MTEKEYCYSKNIDIHYIRYNQNIKEEVDRIINYYANPEPRV